MNYLTLDLYNSTISVNVCVNCDICGIMEFYLLYQVSIQYT